MSRRKPRTARVRTQDYRELAFRAPWHDGHELDAAGEPRPVGKPRLPQSLVTGETISHDEADAEWALNGFWDWGEERKMGERRRQQRDGRAEVAAWLEDNSAKVKGDKMLIYAVMWSQGHSYRAIARERHVRREAVVESVRQLKKRIGQERGLAVGSTVPVEDEDGE